MIPKVSVCIPVYNTELYLAQCLQSVLIQDYDNFEVVIVSDASKGKDKKGRAAKKIIRSIQKECNSKRKERKLSKIEIRFFEHRNNQGLLETRRTLCYEAKGEYIAMVDSDDVMEIDALSSMANAGGYDIIQGRTTSGFFNDDEIFIPSEINLYNNITIGELKGRQIFHEWVSCGNLSGVHWGKLIKRELYLKALENIPYSECNMAEDYLFSFFITQFAKTYLGIESKVYRYRTTTGMSASKKIDDLKQWKMICSTASVFTIISQWIEEHKADSQITDEELNYIKSRTSFYLSNNLMQMKDLVIPELQPAALQMLCDYWGEHFVQTVELQTN